MNDVAKQPTTDSNVRGTHRRRVLVLTVLGLFALAGIGYFTYWLTVARYIESTDDAYVGGDLVRITPQVAGTVVAIGADDTQFVRAGQMLVQLDQADLQAALQRDEANLAQTVREIRNLFVRSAELSSTVAAREVDLARARRDLARRETLSRTGAVSTEDVQHAREAVRVAEAALDGSRQQLAENRALIEGTSVASHPSVASAAARLRTTYLDAQRTVIPAPVAGIVSRRNVQLGQRVSPGTPLMAVVPLDRVWVEANFKEGQLKAIRVGQPVRLVADANGLEYHGIVVGSAAGTGAASALLPPQNATGNWIKVVQRLPVRIALDAKELAAHPLQIGLSMEVEVDVHKLDNASLVSRKERAAPVYRTTVYAEQGREVDGLIATIIAQNDSASLAARQER